VIRSGASCYLPALVAIVVVLLGACTEKQEPVDTVRSFIAAVEAFDLEQAENLVCEEQQARVRKSLESFDNVAGLSEAFGVKAENLTYRERSNDGNVAVVLITGTLKLSFLGQEDIQEVAEEHVVVIENGRWVICDP
jgi:hypothetical protein